jgi:hypothetical protein
MYFYRPNGVMLATWDDVLDFINNKYVNLTKNSIDPKHTFKDYQLKEGTTSVEETFTSLRKDIDALSKQLSAFLGSGFDKIHADLYVKMSEYEYEDELERLKDYLRKPEDIIKNDTFEDFLKNANPKKEIERDGRIMLEDIGKEYPRRFWYWKEEFGKLGVQYQKFRKELLGILEAQGISSEDFLKVLTSS